VSRGFFRYPFCFRGTISSQGILWKEDSKEIPHLYREIVEEGFSRGPFDL
jgi:hypothetical protein